MPSIWSNFSKPKIVTQPHKTHSKLNEKKNSPRCTMALATRDLLVLLVAAVISLASFHWEASFDFAVGPTMSLHTNSGKTEFTNMYAVSPPWQYFHWIEICKIRLVPTDNSNLKLRLKARTDRFRSRFRWSQRCVLFHLVSLHFTFYLLLSDANLHYPCSHQIKQMF